MVRGFRDGGVVAVSDGLGSCSHSDVGARAACKAVVEAASFHFRHSISDLTSMPALVQALWGLMLSGHSPAECSATCLFVVAMRGSGVVLAQLGDGLIAACREDETVDLLVPDKSETFANLTVGLASHDAGTSWRLVSAPENHYWAFVLCTDGIADDLDPRMVKEFAWEVASQYEHSPRKSRGHAARRWLRAWPVPGYSDDKTIACIYREGRRNE